MALVLIVDDDETDRLLMRTILASAGHDLYFASNGEEALKGLDPDASIVAVSGKEPHKLQVAQLAGARLILSKPLTKEGLTDAVEEASRPAEPEPPVF